MVEQSKPVAGEEGIVEWACQQKMVEVQQRADGDADARQESP